jgi:threonine dehydrogenase-like Zn-dependent dehydrogenase
MSEVAGALVEPLACAVRAVGHALGQAGERRPGPLLILGAGTIGLFCLAVARTEARTETYAGDKTPIVISDVVEERRQVAAAWGAALTVNGRAADAEQQLRGALPHGAAAVIDAVGSSTTRALALRLVQPGGRVVLIGLHDETSPLAANYVVRQEINIQGSYSYTPANFGRALDLLAADVVQPSALWVAERPLHTGPAAFAGLVAGAITTPKIILRP